MECRLYYQPNKNNINHETDYSTAKDHRMKQISDKQNGALSRYLSPLAVWALALGCSVGWGSFVMPGTTFLPLAGPWGSVIGLLIGACIMLIIGMNYRSLIARYPDAGGAYTYAGRVLGSDHGFICAWMLILTYIAIIWANSTALSLIVRYIAGDILCFGFSYQIAGYTVYLGELLLSAALILAASLVCALWKRIAAWIQIICCVLMLVGVCATFTAVVIHRGGLDLLKPAFASNNSPATQIFAIVILAPWAYIGFESISHSAQEFRFSAKKTLPIMAFALLTGALCYILLTLCAGMAVPDGYADWGEYIAALGSMEGIEGLPTFYAAREAMGDRGLLILGVSAFCGILTGLVGNFIALSRLIHKLSADGMFSSRIGKLNRRGIPSVAIFVIAGVSCLIPLLGRTAIGWIVDVTTIGATVVYSYTSLCAFIVGRRERRVSDMVWGLIGFALSLTFAVFYLMPSVWRYSELASESYLILIIWSLLGMFVFRAILQRDHSRKLGKSEIVWVLLLVLILIVSIVWLRQSTIKEAADIAADVRSVHALQSEEAGLAPNSEAVQSTGAYITDRIQEFSDWVGRYIMVLAVIIMCALGVIFSIFSIIKKREKQIESERLIAEQNSRAKSTFLSNMSHDIRTPMNAITGYTALALREEDVPEKVHDYLNKIDYSGQHLLSLINDILDMSRIESGKMELTTEPADLVDILDEVYAIFSMQMEEKSLDFSVDYDQAQDTYVVCDKNRLTRILLNLISNALKFTPSGGKVSVVLRQTGADPETAHFELKVADTGIGMSPEFAEHIFDAFERERSVTVDNIQGTGLGMSICKSLVELMGGSIAVESEKDKGTCFTVLLSFPTAERPQEAPAAADDAQGAKYDFTGKRLLVVEDNPINTEIACALLDAEGFVTDTAENGRIAVDAVVAADKGYYDAILLDIHMPVMNGFEAARAIRALDPELAQVPIIALSANGFESDRQEAFDAGMNAHISKPYQPEELFNTLAELIS